MLHLTLLDAIAFFYQETSLHVRYALLKDTIFSSENKYPEGWTTDPGRDSQLEYRLSIMNAAKEDSGIYRCETPARQSHQVEIIVEGKFLTETTALVLQVITFVLAKL